MDDSPSVFQVYQASIDSRVVTTCLYQDPAEQTVTFYDDTFTCPVANCHKVFTDTRNYRNHRVKNHGLPRFNCIVCTLPFDAYQDLIHHMYQENHMVACTVCPLKFRRPGEAHAHYNQKHKEFTCCYCSLRIKGRDNLKLHLQVHNQEASPLNASSYVEVAIDSSFSEYALPSEIHVIQDNDVGGSEYLTIDLEDDDSNAPPDSTSQTPPPGMLVHATDSLTKTCSDTDTADTEPLSDSTSQTPPPGMLVHAADSLSKTCSDTDTADTEPLSDTDSAPTNTFSYGIEECGSSSEAVVFGPGASELFNGASLDQCTPTDSAEPSSLMNKEDDATDWIGHNVDMYQSMSEKHKKTYRYNCSKCSCTFRNKDILKRHLNIHDFVCKHCFIRFSSSADYKSHLHEQHKPQIYNCSVCSHGLHGLKILMVHEMMHRLNLAFKREAEDAVQLDIQQKAHLEHYECEFCKEQIKGLSKFVRHKVWHNWESMWNTYVTGRIFKGTFTEDQAKQFGKEVAKKLEMKWRDCGENKKNSHETLASSEISKAVEETDANNVVDKSTINKSNNTDDDETDSASEAEEDASVNFNGWMNYWYSYLGIDESSPSWVKPIMKNLRLKWKSYNPDDSSPLYKQMDQIGMLLRAQKNGSLDGPTVAVERLPISYFQPKIMHDSHVKKNKQWTINKVTNASADVVSLSTPTPANKKQGKTPRDIKKDSGPALAKRVLSFPPTLPKRLGKIRKHSRDNKAINSFLKCLNSERVLRTISCGRLTAVRTHTLSAQEISVNKSRKQSRKPPSQVQRRTLGHRAGPRNKGTVHERLQPPPQLDTHENLNDQKTPTPPDTPIKVPKCTPSSATGSRNEGSVKLSSELGTHKVLCDQKNSSVPSPPWPVKECRFGMKRPLVVLSRIDWIEPRIQGEKIVEPATSSVTSPATSEFLQMVAWTQTETGCQKIPVWASTLIDCVCKSSLSQAQRKEKMHQVINLIKQQRGDNGSSVQIPEVKIVRWT